MISLRDIQLSFGSQHVFSNINITWQNDQKVGVVGRNGSGKSTLLKVIAGQQALDGGSITIDGTKTFAYMPQDMIFFSQKNIFDEIFSVFDRYIKLEQERVAIETELGIGLSNAEKLIERYNAILNELALFDRREAEQRTKNLMVNLGFTEHQQKQQVDTLSVGWKMRIVLAQLILKDADFYLFDEPTNHLDLVTKEWFLSFLQEAPFGFLLVTHDRHFLEKACTTIFELERGNGTAYNGNFARYLEQKQTRQERLQVAYTQQQKEITRKQKTIDRFRASASKAKMAQSMIKQLEKIDLIEGDPPLPMVSLRFPETVRAGKVVLTIKNISYSFGQKQLFTHVSSEIVRGQKIALVAPNGTGKTTLFNIITGKLPLQNGAIEFGYNVQPAFFEQDQTRVLNPENSVLQEVESGVSGVSEVIIRKFLGSFLFQGDTVFKKIKVLSGGERNRVAMVKVLLQKANLLLLDEPTNHLDMYAKDVLLQALQQYEGTILFVSHDHYFMQHLATGILELAPSGLFYYPGTFEEFLDDKKATNEEKPLLQYASQKPLLLEKQQNTLSTKKIKQLEIKIGRLEGQEQKFLAELEKLSYGTPAYETVLEKLINIKDELTGCMREWEEEMIIKP